jgi:tRNA threonylcarbamoyl adenosine modification protein (Sua5/YciO/YrdC/YwlC family)
MSAVFELTEPDERALSVAAEAVARSEAIVLPTDTVYGVACRPDAAAATDRLFRAKGRPRDLSLPVLAADLDNARQVGSLPSTAERLTERFWPGALTLVVPRAAASASWDLGSARATVALRVPAHPVALALLRRTGPLAATSANRSGRPTPEDCRGVRRELGDSVAVYLCGGRLSPVPSTIVDLSGGEPRVVRAGALDSDEVLRTLR